MTATKTGKANRGFASMDKATQHAIASRGGKAAHAAGTAHQWDRAAASAAGRKGGLAVSANREHMAAMGRRGGLAKGSAAAAQRAVLEANNAFGELS